MITPDRAAPRLQLLQVHLLDPSATNPRKTFTQSSLDDLAASIRQVGVLSPVLVRPSFTSGRFEIVAGERRWRAAQIAALDTVPAIVRDLSDHEVVKLQCIENLQREDVNPHEEAAGYKLLVEHFHYTAEQIAEEIGKSRSYVFGRLKLTELHQDVLDWLASEEDVELSASHLLLVSRIPTPKLQLQAAQEIAGRRPPHWQMMSFREAQEHVRDTYMLRLREAPWWKKDPSDLIEEAGTCGGCPKRSGNACDLFHEVEDPNVCTDPGCHADKRKAWARRLRDEAEAKGVTVLGAKESARVLAASTNYPDPDWVRLDDACQQDGEKRTWRELIKASGAEVAIAAAQEKDTGKLVDVAARTAVALVAKSLKIKLPAVKKAEKPRDYVAEAKARDADDARERIARTAVVEAIRQRYQREAGFAREDFEMIALAMTEMFNDPSTVWQLWGLPESKPTWGAEFQQWRTERLRQMSAEELVRLMIDTALLDEDYNYGKDDIAPITAARLGIDAEAIRAQALAEHDAKVGTVEKAPAKKKRKAAEVEE